jgi:hypothetical protein
MRRFGITLIGLGLAVYFVCAQRLETAEKVPPGLSVEESIRYPAGQYEIGEYGGAMLVGVGLLLLLFPKGR